MKLLRNGRKFVAAPLVVLLAALLAGTALAGGWATIEMDELPGEIHAGETVHLSFMVLQHGQTPVHFLGESDLAVEPLITGTNVKTGETIEISAVPDMSEVGRFNAEIVFPSAGNWEWTVAPRPLGGATELAPLTILPAVKAPVIEAGNSAETAAQLSATTTTTAAGSGGATMLPWAAGLLLVIGAAMMALLISRRKQQLKVVVDAGD
jgi:hypothetical protein